MCDISPVKIDINADLTKPAEDITGMAKDTHKGFGKILYAAYGPWVAKRLGEAKRIEAQAERDAAEIKDGISKYDIAAKEMISLPEVSSIDALCAELESVNSALKAKRLAAAIMAAAIEMKQIPEEEVSDEPLNQTFFNHWRAEAELIDDEDLRQWWAHLLVEETKKPNSISPRTLDVAKNLSPYEAKLFEKLSLGICENFIITDQNDVPVSGAFSDILTLQDAGLINAQSSMITQERKSEENSRKYFVFAKAGYVVQIFSKRAAVLKGHSLTKAGRELYNIIQVKQASLSSMIEIATIISQNSMNRIASIHEINSASTDGDVKTLTFSDDPVWSSESVQESGDNK